MLSGAISWVGKQAQLNANPVSLGEGQCSWSPKPSLNDTLNPEDPGCNHSILPASSPFNLCNQDQPTQVARLPTAAVHDGRCPSVTLGHHIKNEVKHHKKSEIKAGGNRSYGPPHPHHLYPLQIVGLRVTEVQHQHPHQCHQGLIDLEVPGIQTAVWWCCTQVQRPYENQPASLQGWRTWKTPPPTKAWCLELMVYHCHWVPRSHPSPLCYPFPTMLPGGVGEKSGDRHHPGWCTHHIGCSITTMSRP